MRIALFVCLVSLIYGQDVTFGLRPHFFAEKRTLSEKAEPAPQKKEEEPVHPGGFLFGEFLYWQPMGLELDYAATGNTASSTLTKKHFVDYNWAPGFKVAAGWRFPTKWDLTGIFTYLKPHGSDRARAPVGGSLISAFDKTSGTTYQSASSRVHLDYLIADLEMGRRKFIFHNYVMRFILGFRGAWIEQDWKNTFTPVAGAITIARNKWNVKGGGGRAGVSLLWDSPLGIGFFSKMTFALLIIREELLYQQSEPSLQNINVHFKQDKLAPTMDFELGLAWEKFFTEKWGINLSAGYQITTWWNLNEKLRQGNVQTFDEKEADDLYLQGLTAHAGVFF